MNSIINILYGSLHFNKKLDYIIIPFKVLYILYSIPFLLFTLLLAARSFGAFKSSSNEEINIIKKILLHLADVFWSFALWGIIINAFLGNLGAK